MNRCAFLPVLALVFAACHGEKKNPIAAALPQDTMPMNLDTVHSAIPPAVPDSFTAPAPAPTRARPRIPPAPPALVDAVEREQSFTQFCYEEFGQKADPTLQGGVAMVVTVASTGISDARVADDTWSSQAGKAVNACLNDKAAKAWKPVPGAVRPGKYLVQLSFRPS